MPQRIQRKRTKGWRLPPNTVCVSRPSKFGNPFRAADYEFGAVAAVALFATETARRWRYTSAGMHEIRELRGKDLACWCPLVDKDGNRVPCHADVLLEIANSP